mgnify:FL=1
MRYPEVHSLEESLAILDKYKDDLTKEQYEQNKSIICGFAIENMFANEEDIINLIKVDKQEKTPDEIIAEYKKEWGVNDWEVLKFLDDGIPENDFDKELLASNLVSAINLIQYKNKRVLTRKNINQI